MSVARFDEISADIRDRAVDMLRATASKRVILHADVTKVKLQPGTMAQVAEEWRRDLLPAMQGHAGYRGCCSSLFPHRPVEGRGVRHCPVWRRFRPGRGPFRPECRWRFGQLARYFAGLPSQGTFEVEIDDRR